MASSETLVSINALNNEPPTSAFATLDTRVGIPILDFDAATAEDAEFGLFMPRHYDGGGLTVTIGWMASTATSGNVKWNLAMKSVSDDADDLDTKAYAAANTVTATTASASGEVDYADITFTDGSDMDSIAAGEYFRMKLTRDAADAADTMSGDAELVFIRIKET